MLRDLVLSTCVLIGLGFAFRYPFAGVLTWAWLTLMQPHQEVYGVISSTLRLNLIVAVVTIFAWLFSKERKIPTGDTTSVAVVVFLAWMTFNCLFAVEPSSSWAYWDRVWRIMALGLLVAVMANDKIRIHALVWVVVASLMYYGVKGGILSLLTGGAKQVSGPTGSMITDNNHLAVALLMVLPLVNYLRVHTANRLVRIGLVVAFCLMFLAILGSYSRGAYLALGALAVVGWARSRNRFAYPLVAAALIVPVLYFMPESFYARLGSLNSVEEDASFQGRLDAWYVAFSYAKDHFPLGAGFEGTGKNFIWQAYLPGATIHAAHSIYFQVLGEHGFAGLAIYLTILFLVFLNCQEVRNVTRNREEYRWAYDLATMMQLSMFVFCVGAAALSLAYYDVFVIWAGLAPALLNVVRVAQTPRAKAQTIGPPGLPAAGRSGTT